MQNVDKAKLGDFASDLGGLLVGAVAAFTIFAPIPAARWGVGVALLISLPRLAHYRLRAADKALLAFTVLTLASLYWTAAPDLTLPVVKDQMATALLFISIRAVITTRRFLVMGIVGFTAGGLWSVKLILAENYGVRLMLSQDQGPRVSVDDVNANYIAYGLITAIALIVILISASRAPVVKWLPGVVASAVLFAGIQLTGTRGALISLVVLAVWLVAHRFLPSRAAFRALVVGVAVVGIAIMTGVADAAIRLRTHAVVGRETGDLNGRLTIWPVARHWFNEHLFFGSGAGSFPALNARGIYAHDVLLDVGVGLGLAGLLILAVFVVHLGREVLDCRDPSFARFALGTMLAASAAPLLSGYWYAAPAFWIALGFVSRASILRAREPQLSADTTAPASNATHM